MSVDRFGVCLRTFNVWPDGETLRELHDCPLRFKVLDRELVQYDLAILQQDVTLCLLLDGETDGGLAGMANMAAWIRSLNDQRIRWIVVINEWDTFDDLTADTVVQYYASVAAQLDGSTIEPVLGSVVSEQWEPRLAEAINFARACGIRIQNAAFHPYGKRGDVLRAAIIRANDIAGCPIVVDEYGWSLEDAGDQDAQADIVADVRWVIDILNPSVLAVLCWFGLTDSIRSPGEGSYGLIGSDGNRRKAYDEFMLKEDTPVDFNVGSGLLDMMSADGTEPVGDSEWFNWGERNFGVNGTFYVWISAAGKGFRYFPDPE